MSKFEKYLTVEIAIEYKSCLYFFGLGFFYCMYRLFCGQYEASILHLGELIVATYGMGYLQVYLLRNFDEGEHFGLFEGVSIVGCSALYVAASWLCGWFSREVGVTLLFACYVLFLYGCMFLVNKLKREIDTKLLNIELDAFKKRGE